MSKKLFIVLLLITNYCFSQPYAVKNGNTRHRFAQMEFGIVQYYSPQSGTTQAIASNGKIGNYQFGKSGYTALLWGGTHFWGHVDWALTIPIASYGTGMKYGVDLQTKFFPSRIQEKKVRPYLGISMSPFAYHQNDGPEISRTMWPLLGGLNYYSKRHQFELGVIYNYYNPLPYYLNRTTIGEIKVQPLMFAATYKYTLETTAGLEKNWRNGKTKKLTKELGESGKLNGFSIAVGPTSSFRVENSDYLQKKFPFAGQHSWGTTAEFGLGYYLYKPDIQLNVAYRKFSSELNAYGYSDQVSRKALTFEGYKYLFDYNGFKPYIGVNMSLENINLVETQNVGDSPKSFQNKSIEPGLTIGWDIWPDRLQTWTLRTNLRWYPTLGVKMADGSKNALSQLEFNFIQLVVYPQRLKLRKVISEN